MCLPGTVIVTTAPDFPEMFFRSSILILVAKDVFITPLTTLRISMLAFILNDLHFDFQINLMIGLLAL